MSLKPLANIESHYTSYACFDSKTGSCPPVVPTTGCASRVKSYNGYNVVVFIPISEYPNRTLFMKPSRYKGVGIKSIQKWLDFLKHCGINADIALEPKFKIYDEESYKNYVHSYGLPVVIYASNNFSPRGMLAAVEALRYIYTPQTPRTGFCYELQRKYNLSHFDALVFCTTLWFNENTKSITFNTSNALGSNYYIPTYKGPSIFQKNMAAIHSYFGMEILPKIRYTNDYNSIDAKSYAAHRLEKARLTKLANEKRSEFFKEIFKLRDQKENEARNS